MMADGFLTIVKRALGDGDYAGDQHGGARGADGSGLPTGNPGNFMFATGSSAPTSRSTRAGLAVKGIMIHQDHGSGCLARTAITMDKLGRCRSGCLAREPRTSSAAWMTAFSNMGKFTNRRETVGEERAR